MRHHQTQTHALAGVSAFMAGAAAYASVIRQPGLAAACVVAALALAHAARREHCHGIEARAAAVRGDRAQRFPGLVVVMGTAEAPAWCCVTGEATSGEQHADECADRERSSW
ncbi:MULTISPECIES: hypothetical protein [Streptomyces]|uniref:hypothetical protein n=1 Tax=Streptomyces TaxID=1883 RepID=UPI00345C4DD9